jgi:hypothetical protein
LFKLKKNLHLFINGIAISETMFQRLTFIMQD